MPGVVGVTASAMLFAHGVLAFALVAYLGALLAFVWGAKRASTILRTNPDPRIDEVDCHANPSVVHIGERSIARDAIQSAAVVRTTDAAEVVIVTTPSLAPRIRLSVPTVEAGELLLDEIGLSVRHRAARFVTAAPIRAHVSIAVIGVLMATMGLALTSQQSWSPILVASALVTAVLILLSPHRVVVGADGVLLSWLFGRRFVHYDDIDELREEVSFGERRLMLHLRSGEQLLISLGSKKATTNLGTLIARIETARDQYASGDVAEAVAALRRGDREIGSWIGRLRALTDVGQHREGAVVESTLWRILESPASPPLTRAAAAVALKPRSDERDRLRIENVTQSAASEALQRALEAEEDAELAEALTELEMNA